MSKSKISGRQCIMDVCWRTDTQEPLTPNPSSKKNLRVILVFADLLIDKKQEPIDRGR
jgi:hypothetical protein